MSKSTDIKDHPSSYSVGKYNKGDEFISIEYLDSYDKALGRYKEVEDQFDYVYLYKLDKCSEKVAGNK